MLVKDAFYSRFLRVDRIDVRESAEIAKTKIQKCI